MSKSTAADLAIAFRSLERRRREAVDAVEGAPIGSLLSELDGHIAAAASVLGSDADAAAVADAVTARPTDEWDEGTLDTLRQHATDAGTALRRIIDAGAQIDD